MKHVLSSALVLGAVSMAALTGCQSSETPEKPTSYTKVIAPEQQTAALEPLPSPARLALERLTQGQLTHLSTDEFEGRDIYTATYLTADGTIGHAQVSSDGRVLSNYTETSNLAVTEAPESVQNALRAHTGGAPLQTIAVERHGERDDRYIAMTTLSGKKHRYEFNSTGSLVSEATQINPDQMLPAATASLERRFPGITGSKSIVWESRDRNGKVGYGVQGWSEKKLIRATVNTDGKIEKVHYLGE